MLSDNFDFVDGVNFLTHAPNVFAFVLGEKPSNELEITEDKLLILLAFFYSCLKLKLSLINSRCLLTRGVDVRTSDGDGFSF